LLAQLRPGFDPPLRSAYDFSAAKERPNPLPIETYGNYQLLKRLATGGMAQIYLARQKGPDGAEKLVVVKRILPHLAENSDFVRMFLDEARIAARLNHPNIVQVFDLGSLDDTFFIAMEFIHGEDLRKIWKRTEHLNKPFPVQLVCRVVMDACAGLDYAHKKTDAQGKPLGIVHRDISPQNLLVTFDGAVKIVDFGIAKAADQATVTRSGVLKGKYSYMSPEQASGKRVDCRSDIFALGVVLHELLTGQRLFKRSNDIQTLHAVTECDVPVPSNANPKVPPELDEIVLKALAKNPADRYQEAMDLQLALEDFLIFHKLPSSSAHLAAFMGELYEERLAEERRAGHVLVGEDLDSAPRPLLDDLPAAAASASASASLNAIGRMRTSSMDGRLPLPPAERLERSLGNAAEREATTAERLVGSSRRHNSREGVHRDPSRTSQPRLDASLSDPPHPGHREPEGRPLEDRLAEHPASGDRDTGESHPEDRPVDTLIGQISDLDAQLTDASQEDPPLTEPLPVVRSSWGLSSAKPGDLSSSVPSITEDASRSFSNGSPLSLGSRKRSRFSLPVLALLASSLVAGGVAGYLLLSRRPVAPGSEAMPSYASVSVDSFPSGATVVFDGKPGDPTPCTLPRMPAGTYTLVLDKPGFKSHTSTVTVPASGNVTVPLVELEPEPSLEPPRPSLQEAAPPDAGSAPALRTVTLTVSAEPEATVYVGDESRGRTPVILEGAPGSGVEVRLERSGYQTSHHLMTFGDGPREEFIKLIQARSPSARIKTAKVRFAVTPWADDVQCGARRLGNTPFPDVELPVGTHQCKFYNKNYGTRTLTVEVRPNILNKVPFKF